MAGPDFDLDLDDEEPPPTSARRRLLSTVRVPLWVVVVTGIAAAVVAAASTRAWDTRQAVQTAESTVAVSISVTRLDLDGGGDESDGYRYRSHVEVTNFGPLPVDLERLTTPAGDLVITSIAGSKVRVLPGTVGELPVQLLQDCSRWRGAEPNPGVDLRLDLTTADGVRRTYTTSLSIGETSWRDVVESNCAF